MEDERFTDRWHAGEAVAGRMAAYRCRPSLLILALPRGGVPVAAEVARALDAPLDVLVVRKIGVPGHRELAMGAIAAVAGTIETVRNADVMAQMNQLNVDADAAFAQVAARERDELNRRQRAYRGDRPPVEVTGRTVILVDDGLATGATMRAAITVVKQEKPERLVVAVPVGSRDTCDELRQLVDELVCVSTPEPFWAVGQAYVLFDQTTDDEVRRILGTASGVNDD